MRGCVLACACACGSAFACLQNRTPSVFESEACACSKTSLHVLPHINPMHKTTIFLKTFSHSVWHGVTSAGNCDSSQWQHQTMTTPAIGDNRQMTSFCRLGHSTLISYQNQLCQRRPIYIDIHGHRYYLDVVYSNSKITYKSERT